jgi:RNA polymerase sigma-70 factor (ECF subfamily)
MNQDSQRDTFEIWVREHAGILHRVANGFATGADRDDLMQELLLAVWRAVPAYAGESKVSTFLYRVAHNAALTWRRGAVTYARHVARLAAEPVEASGAGRESDETLALIYAAIRQLDPVERSLILLHLDGVSYAAIGEIHGLTENNVGVRLTRLRQKLAETLKEKSHELR